MLWSENAGIPRKDHLFEEGDMSLWVSGQESFVFHMPNSGFYVGL